MNNLNIRQIADSEYYASLFGACILSFGIGVLFADFISSYLSYGIIVIGILIHGWGMYKTQKRNR